MPTVAPGSVSPALSARAGRKVASRPRSAAPHSGRADDLGEAPVDHQRLAERAQEDVAGLQIAVDHAPAVGIGDGVADGDEPAQQPPQR